MNDNLIATDSPLTTLQQQTLCALADTLLPASDDGRMPSAGELEVVAYFTEQARDYLPILAEVLASFDEPFCDLPLLQRLPLLESFSDAHEHLFNGFLTHVYRCYYHNDSVLLGLGLAAGPPFPRGNTIEAGDLSLLDPVVRSSQTYRK